MSQQQLPTDLPILTNTDKAKLIAQLVKRFEDLEHERAIIDNDEKVINNDGKEADLTRAEMAALKRLAKLRYADKVEAEREKMTAMATVASAMGVDLFNWMDQRG